MPLATAEMLGVPAKRTCSVSYAPALLQCISSTYAEDADIYKSDCSTLNELRESSVHVTDLSDPSTIEQLFTYYSQITFLCSRFPLDVGITFPWYSAFPSANKNPESLSLLNYERACVLFSAGTIMSQLGCLESKVSTESIRKACNHFQNASGCFKFIRREIIIEMDEDLPPDLSPKMLDALVGLMLAQAQECACLKSVMEHMNPGTISRLASKASDFYSSICGTVFPIEWKIHIDTKAAHFMAISQYYKANECIAQAKYGEEITRLRIAEQHNQVAVRALLHHANESAEMPFIKDVRNLQISIKRDLLRAEKDNDTVYMESVPEPDQLPPILRSEIVKPILPSILLDNNCRGHKYNNNVDKQFLFEELMPLAFHQANKIYAIRKSDNFKLHFMDRYETAQTEWQSLLDEYNMPRMLDLVDPDTIPASLAACAEEVQHEGGSQALQEMLNKVQQISSKNTHLIDQGFRELEEESDQDNIMRRQYGSLWTRPSSRHLTASLLKQGSAYYATLQEAQKADHIVRAKVDSCRKAIDLLSLPMNEIIASIPCSKDDTPEHRQLVELVCQLRTLLADCENTEKEQATLVKEANALVQSDDILPILEQMAEKETDASHLTKTNSRQFECIFVTQLKKYDPLRAKMDKAVDAHKVHLETLHQLYGRFSEFSSNYPVIQRRQKVIQNLEQTFIRFKEIRSNLVEGVKFYSQYADTLLHFRNSCDDFALARRMEATDLTQCARVYSK